MVSDSQEKPEFVINFPEPQEVLGIQFVNGLNGLNLYGSAGEGWEVYVDDQVL